MLRDNKNNKSTWRYCAMIGTMKNECTDCGNECAGDKLCPKCSEVYSTLELIELALPMILLAPTALIMLMFLVYACGE